VSTEQERRTRAAHDAAAWLLRLESDATSVHERAEFVDWLRESPLHVAEMLRLARLQRSLGRFSRWHEVDSQLLGDEPADASNVIPLTYAPEAPKPAARRFNRLFWVTAAASVMVASLLLLFDTRGAIGTQVE